LLAHHKREQFDMEGKVQQTIHSCIKHLLHDELYEDVGKQSEEGEDEDDDSVEDDEADEEEGEEETGEGGGGRGEEKEAVQDPEMQKRQFRV
jgi:hypothetical protein